MYHDFTYLFSKLSESTFYMEISQFQLKVQSYKYQMSHFARDSPTLLRTPVSAIFGFAPKIDNASVVMLNAFWGNTLQRRYNAGHGSHKIEPRYK